MDQVELAEAIATTAHAGQVDKAGVAYIEHPRAVAEMVPDTGTYHYQVAAWLHDVLEDTKVTAQDLVDMGVDENAVFIVELLTRKRGQTAEQYYELICTNEIALTVKLADIANNLDEERMARLDMETQERLIAKYGKGLRLLLPGVVRFML